MEYMDIRVRIPLNKLGTFIQLLPNVYYYLVESSGWILGRSEADNESLRKRGSVAQRAALLPSHLFGQR